MFRLMVQISDRRAGQRSQRDVGRVAPYIPADNFDGTASKSDD